MHPAMARTRPPVQRDPELAHDARRARVPFGPSELFRVLVKVLLLSAGLVVLLWFLHEIRRVVLFLVLVVILAMVLSAPVTWLERKNVPRSMGTLLVFLAVASVSAFVGWLVLPQLVEEVPRLLDELPQLVEGIAERVAGLLGNHPEVERQLSQIVEWVMELIGGVWRHADVLFGAFVLSIFMVALVLYLVVSPRPLLEGYIRAFPAHLRGPATRALTRSSNMVVGWMLANVIVGAMKAALVFPFLMFMQVPGAIIWAVLAFFVQLIPRIGFYLMSIPPVVVALSLDPLTALWVALFYWAISELMGNLVAPWVQSATMDLHPAYLLAVTLALALGFGLIGVLIASPVAGFLYAYWDEFYLSRRPEDPQLEQRVDAILAREVREEE